jgi:hypothetical protein
VYRFDPDDGTMDTAWRLADFAALPIPPGADPARWDAHPAILRAVIDTCWMMQWFWARRPEPRYRATCPHCGGPGLIFEDGCQHCVLLCGVSLKC